MFSIAKVGEVTVEFFILLPIKYFEKVVFPVPRSPYNKMTCPFSRLSERAFAIFDNFNSSIFLNSKIALPPQPFTTFLASFPDKTASISFATIIDISSLVSFDALPI